MIKVVLFDFDGTLVNTNDVIIASWQHTYRHYRGREEDVKKITACFGEPLLITMAREFPEVPPEESAEVYRVFQQENADSMVKIFPGIMEMLAQLKEAGYRMGIVTSRKRESAHRYVNMFGMAEYFETLVTCDDTTAHKPDPTPIFLCLERMGLKPEEAIMVGDSPFDIKCANNAGVKSVMVDWRATCDETSLIPDARVDFNIGAPGELLNILRGK